VHIFTTRGEGSRRSLVPFPGCNKAALFLMDSRKICTRWVRAKANPHLWTPERIARDCAGCMWWKGEQK
jgi:hypothetical protein